MPEISVIVCIYNHGAWIERCIRSLILQKNIKQDKFEIIIVNDASKDYTKKILTKFKKIKNIIRARLILCIILIKNYKHKYSLPSKLTTPWALKKL